MSDWSWKLRAFFSADISGSTAFKSSHADDKGPQPWAMTFKEFFRDFPDEVDTAYSNLEGQYPDLDNHHMMPWKFSGDEVLFSVELTNYKQILSHAAAFANAVTEYPKRWRDKKVPLGLKAAGWLAGFPVTNTEVFLTQMVDDKETVSRDYIGPSIDLGFRLASFSEGRKFVMSASMALMILDTLPTAAIPTLSERHNFHLEKKARLKGIINDKPYPIVWMDLLCGEVDLEEKLLGIDRRDYPSELRKYLRHFIDETPRLEKPFIDGDEGEYGIIPPEFDNLRKQMQDEDGDRGYLSSSGQEEQEATEAQTEPPSEDTLEPK